LREVYNRKEGTATAAGRMSLRKGCERGQMEKTILHIPFMQTALKERD
jgi:hypothetical protein